MVLRLANLIMDVHHNPVNIDSFVANVQVVDGEKQLFESLLRQGEMTDPNHTEQWPGHSTFGGTQPLSREDRKQIGISHKLLQSIGKLQILNRKNLSAFRTWEQDVISKIALVSQDNPIKCQAVVITWIWGGIDIDLQMSCGHLAPLKVGNMDTAEYLEKLRKALEPDGPAGMARWNFKNSQQGDMEVTRYWQETYHKYLQMEVDEEDFFIQVFTDGLSSETMRNNFISLEPTDPEDCKAKALRAWEMAVTILKSSNRPVHDSAWRGLKSTGSDIDSTLKFQVYGKTKEGINALFGGEEGDAQVRDEESEQDTDFWEEMAALTASGRFGKCWGCNSEDHLKNKCPLRREGPGGKSDAMRNQQRLSRGDSFQ